MTRARLSPAAAATLVGVSTFVFRYLTSGALENDHFVMLARAYQALYGDWPVRDFEDPGQPLAYLISTAAAALFGRTLLVNVVLCILLLCVTAALAYLLALRATDSMLAALVVAAVTIIVYPRMYNTTKVIVPVVAIWLGWRYADAPSLRRLIALAFWTAIAFLLRHDYVLSVAAASVVLLAMRHADSRPEVARTIAVYSGLSLLFMAPWLVYVQWYEGLPEYLAAALRFVAAEGQRTTGGPPPALFYLLAAVPVAGIVAAFRTGARLTAAQLGSASVLLLLIDVEFLRDVLAARVPDVVAPTAVIAAAVAGHFFSPRLLGRAALVAMAVVIVAAAAQVAARAPADLSPLALARQSIRVTQRLRNASPEITPNPSLAPLVGYLTRCTPPDDRILVAGFGPEIPVLAHRPFAAGLPSWIPGYYESAVDVNRALEHLRREQVGATVLLDGSTVFTRLWPALAQSVRERGVDEYGVPSINSRIRVWLPHATASAPRDASTDLPCPAP